MRRATICLILLPLLLATACARAPGSGAGPAEVSARQDPNLLLAADVQGFGTALQAIRALRSQWLRVRSAGSLTGNTPVQVYTDGMRMGGPDTLERMGTADIATIQYFDGRTASQRWGLGHENGVIFVTSRNR